MKTSKAVVLATVLCGLSALTLAAQQRPENNREGRPDANRRPASPFMVALDLNRDGVLSSDEIQRAPESLLKLDKNGDGQLTRDELRPPRNRPESGEDGHRRNPREDRDSSEREKDRERPERPGPGPRPQK